MARTLKLTVSYDGTRFVGWQRQAEGVSIQGLLEEAIARFEGAPVAVHGAGRTDAGVHALGQVASVQITSAHPTDAVARGLNASLPQDVRVTDVQEAAADFHARFSARSKTYRYLLRNASLVSPFERAFVWHVPEALDLDAMRTGANALVGTHDFAAFSSSPGKTSPKRAREGGRSTGSDTKDTIRTISQSELDLLSEPVGAGFSRPSVRLPFDSRSGHPERSRGVKADPTSVLSNHSLLAYEITGDGFLRHMVRAIVGTLVEIGRGQRPAASIAALLAGGSRAHAGATAPPQGLFLVRVVYD